MQNTASARLSRDISPEEYDLVILGGGTGGTIAAWTFAGQGQRVAAIDRKYIGGSCPNIALYCPPGCDPDSSDSGRGTDPIIPVYTFRIEMMSKRMGLIGHIGLICSSYRSH
jgi:choline dehydrogenase-like flavoprotein